MEIITNYDNLVAVMIFPKHVDKKGLFEESLGILDRDRPSP